MGSSNLYTIIIRNLSDTYPINDTELPKYFWTLKAYETDYHLKWSKKTYSSRYRCGSRCDLCLTEKMVIALAGPKVLLKKELN